MLCQHLGRRRLRYLLVQLPSVEGMSSEQSCAPSHNSQSGTGHPRSDLPALSLHPEQCLCSVGGQDPQAISEAGDRADIGIGCCVIVSKGFSRDHGKKGISNGCMRLAASFALGSQKQQGRKMRVWKAKSI